MKSTNRWELPGVVFHQIEDHGFSGRDGQPLYGYGPADQNQLTPTLGELFLTLDEAIVAWIGEKYTARRGAGGTGVDTAAGWFMRMIGAGELVEVEHEEAVTLLAQAMAASDETISVRSRARRVLASISDRDLAIAKVNTP